MQERKGAVTLKGNKKDLVGPELKVGDRAPDFTCTKNDLSPITLKDTAGKPRVFLSILSVSTGICDPELKRFNEAAAGLSGVEVYAVSMDLPFTQKDWCSKGNVERVHTISDHKDASFAQGWGVLVKDLRVTSRAVFVVDQHDKLTYVEYCPEIASHPNYDAALAAAKAVAK